MLNIYFYNSNITIAIINITVDIVIKHFKILTRTFVKCIGPIIVYYNSRVFIIKNLGAGQCLSYHYDSSFRL